MTLDATEDTFPVDPIRYSSWLKLKRIQAWVTRFIENCQTPKTARTSGQLVADELKRVEVQLIKQTQRSYFRDEDKPLHHELLIFSMHTGEKPTNFNKCNFEVLVS